MDAPARLPYYDLRIRPFQPTADPEFLWLGKRHREVLSAMKAGVLENAGLVLLTGDVGTGKTTLTRALEESLGAEVSVARIDYPGLDPLDFFGVVATAYGLGDLIVSRETFLQRLVPFLTHARAIGRSVLLILDEAQSLSRELFEEIEHLSGLEHENVRLLNILLVGQDELGAIVRGPPHRDLGPHIAARYRIEPLTVAEVDEYIRHRLTVAGAAQSPFGADAVREIAALSRGVPRLINLIADFALLRGFKAKAKPITPDIVGEWVRDLTAQDLGGRPERRRRYGSSSAGPRRRTLRSPRHRAAVSAALVASLVIVGGYFYSRGLAGAGRGGPELVSPRGDIELVRRSESIGRRSEAEPARAVAAEPAATAMPDQGSPASAAATAPRPADEGGNPARARRVWTGEPALASLRPRPTPPPREGATTERAASDSTVTKPPRPVAPLRDAASREAAETPDPGAIIDWLLRESPTRRE